MHRLLVMPAAVCNALVHQVCCMPADMNSSFWDIEAARPDGYSTPCSEAAVTSTAHSSSSAGGCPRVDSVKVSDTLMLTSL